MSVGSRAKPGDRVVVPWGVDEIEGTVLDVYGSPEHRFALVAIAFHGTRGETLVEEDVAFPLREVKVVAAA